MYLCPLSDRGVYIIFILTYAWVRTCPLLQMQVSWYLLSMAGLVEAPRTEEDGREGAPPPPGWGVKDGGGL